MRQASIRDMASREHKRFFKYLQQDFSAGEYPPYFILHGQLQEGSLQGLVFTDSDGQDMAYALNAVHETRDMVLISYYAVLADFRGTGVGTQFLQAIAERHATCRGLVVEVEKPEEADSVEERDIRTRRIRFYEKAGFQSVPDVAYAIWGIPMHLMVRPVSDTYENLAADLPERMRDLYLPLLGRTFIHRMNVRRVKGE